jgi:hypothetical protein
MREVDWTTYGQRAADVASKPDAAKTAGENHREVVEKLRKGCNVSIETFLNWLGWFDHQLTKGGGGIDELKLGTLLDYFIGQTKDPDVRKKFEGISWYWIYPTPDHPSTCGGVVL